MEAVRQIIQWIGAHPYGICVVVTIVAFMESLVLVGLIVPGALILFGVGALVANGTVNFWPVFVAAVLGAIAGDGISYEFGRHHGERVRRLKLFRR